MGKKTEKTKCIHAHIILKKVHKAGNIVYKVQDLGSGESFMLPVGLAKGPTDLPNGNVLFWVKESHRSYGKLKALSAEEHQKLVAQARALHAQRQAS